ncbi:MAG TPA: hypothetical protein VKM93_20045 [Terriglobia bacterium]|nr:hypothetical protein [Terriglobia bacterium]
MAPEAPGNLVVLDLRYSENDILLKTVEEVEPPQQEPAYGWLRVRFDEAPDPDFYPVGRGVVHVSQPEGYKHCPPGAESDVLTLGGGPRRYVFNNVALGEGLQLVLVLPKGHTLSEFSPAPTSAKEFEGRLAVYFRPEQKYGQTATVTWQLRKFRRSVKSEAERLRGEFSRGAQTQNFGAQLDREDPNFKEAKPARKSAVAAASDSEQPLSAWAYAGMALVGLIGAVGLTIFYVYQGPRIAQSGAQSLVSSVLQILIALACATFLFGTMKSTGKFTSKSSTFGGPAALFIVVLSLLIAKGPTGEPFDLTVRAHSADGSAPIIKSGEITIDLDSDRRSKPINSSGEADFKNIPAKFKGTTVGVLPQVDGYKQEWQRLKLEGAVLDVTLQPAPQPVTRLTGSIIPPPKDWASLRLMVDGQSVEGKVNELGRFDFQVNGNNGDRVRLKVYDGAGTLIYDEYQTLPGGLNIKLHRK